MNRCFTLLVALAVLGLPATSLCAPVDNDGDGLDDAWEKFYFYSITQQDGQGDPDEDGLENSDEQLLGTDPTLADTDGDGMTDKEEVDHFLDLDPTTMDTDGDFLTDTEELNETKTDPTKADTDNDGLSDFMEILKGYNPLMADTDGGGVIDGGETINDGTDPLVPQDDQLDSDKDGITNYCEGVLGTDAFSADTDGDWLLDGEEIGVAGMEIEPGDCPPPTGDTDPLQMDSDGDGLHDGWEVLVYHTDPQNVDSDGDGLTDGAEHDKKMTDPLCQCLSPAEDDSDFDGLSDFQELGAGALSVPCDIDSDNDGVLDVSEVYDGTDPMSASDKAADTDGDGLSDAYETNVANTDPDDADTDGDNMFDSEEILELEDRFILDPKDADTDDDGLLDGNEGGKLLAGKLVSGTDPTKADSDNDGLNDGLEKGLATPQTSTKDPDATALDVFQSDTDPSTKTDPLDSDSDNDGLSDGAEDKNYNGFKEADETDPNVFDTDGDGMDDKWETTYSTLTACPPENAPGGPLDPLNPADADLDSDGDGLTNFAEYQSKYKVGLNQILDNKTNPCAKDSDEDGLSDWKEAYSFYPLGENPFTSKTNPNNPDTDGDGLKDGDEDANHNGLWEAEQETNPLKKDTDSDDLTDGFEVDTVKGPGTDPTIPDTDGDGLDDGMEVNQLGTDPLNPDTDGDNLWDGLEMGVLGDGCPQSKTNPHVADTDKDGLADGVEDADQDGCWDKDAWESSPLFKDSDGDGLQDPVEAGLGTNPCAKDSDEDTIPDPVEVGDQPDAPFNVDGDALIDALDPDSDDDHISDFDEAGDLNPLSPPVDTDEDGIPDYQDPDADGDSIADVDEAGDDSLDTAPDDFDQDGIPNFQDLDSDGDGVPDQVEAGDDSLDTEPVNTDSDGLPDYLDLDADNDTLGDNIEHFVDSDHDGQPNPDADGDGTPNFQDLDSDNAQGPDSEELLGDEDGDDIPDFVDPIFDEQQDLDSDGDGLKNWEEDNIGTDPHNPDTDGDGLNDKVEVDSRTDPLDLDSDDDGLADGDDGVEDGDADWLVHALDPDSDNDGIFDGTETGKTVPLDGFTYVSDVNKTYLIAGTDLSQGDFQADKDPATVTDHTDADSDGDGVDDGAEDPDHNGRVDLSESDPTDEADTLEYLDDDQDGLSNQEEYLLGLGAEDGDLDQDGVLDGDEHNWRSDTDKDGLPNYRDPDSDDDGLADGLERGIQPDQLTSWTQTRFRNWIQDQHADSTTCALLADSDFDGFRDGLEDFNHNGAFDQEAGESDPLNAASKPQALADSDGDTIPDVEEETLGLDPLDSDSDDDGLPDGQEPTFGYDTDLDGLSCALDPDSDDDGLADGTEAGLDAAVDEGNKGTDIGAGNFIPDADPATTTGILNADSDHSGVQDGSEDTNKNGKVDPGESDPLFTGDDYTVCIDTDQDGLCTAEEQLLGTLPDDADSDDDGVLDGLENNWNFDTDGDGVINALDEDADGEGLVDGLEMCVQSVHADTDLNAGVFVKDADTASCTFMVVADSDHGGVSDADEDLDLNGRVDPGETDPNDPTDDGQVNPSVDGLPDGLLPEQVEQEDIVAGDNVQDGWTDGTWPDVVWPDGFSPDGVGGDWGDAFPPDGAEGAQGWDVRLQGGVRCSAAPDRRGGTAVALLLLLALIIVLAVARSGRWTRFLPFVLVLCFSWPALAQSGAGTLDGNYFRLDPDGSAIFFVQTDRIPKHMEIRGGASLHYLHVAIADDSSDGVFRKLLANRVETQLSGVLGLLDFMEVGIHLPVVLYQGGQMPGFGAQDLGVVGLGNMSVFGKFQLLSSNKGDIGLAAYLPVYIPTNTSDDYLGPDGFGASPSLVFTRRKGSLLYSLNAGYVAQPRTETYNIVDDDKYFGGMALAFSPKDGKVEAGVELFAFTRADEPFSSKEELQAEAVGGFKVQFGPFRVTAGAGTGLAPGVGTPDWRLFSQVVYAHVPDPDRDKDGILNEKDRCPDKAEDKDGFEDNDGCPEDDNDKDGIPDVTDKCRNQAEDKDGFEDEDGCPELDNDKDGINDAQDECPNKPEDFDKYKDKDGCPDPDNDGDGIPDVKDKCPNKRETFNDFEDEDGCPDKKLVEFKPELRQIQILEKIHFGFMSARIQPESYELLNQIVRILKDNKHVLVIQVEGHTDKTGTDSFNVALSRERAESVVEYFVGEGIDRKRLKAMGYGSSRRIDYRSGPEANFNNRRVEFNVLKYSDEFEKEMQQRSPER